MSTIVSTALGGDVFMRDFDLGFFSTIGAGVVGDRVFVPSSKIPGVKVPLYDENHGNPDEVGKNMPGFPVIFGNPSDDIQRYNLPSFRILREDPSPALERWMSVHLKTRGPAPGANPVQVQYGGRTIDGYDKYVEQEGSWPYDIPYTLTVGSAGLSARTEAQALLKYIMKIFKPYSILNVVDSLGEDRKYHAFVEGPTELSEIADIRNRSIIYALSIRVSAEYDLADPYEITPITQVVQTLGQLSE